MTSATRRALVVEDEERIQRLIVRALRIQGFQCDVSADGDEASRLAAQSRFDVVVTDLKIPKKNGHALVLELLQQENRPLIVVHTGVVEPRLTNDLVMRGVDDIVFKPTDYAVLAAKISALVARRTDANKRPNGGSFSSQSAPMKELSDEDSTIAPINLSQLNGKLAEISTFVSISNAAIDVYEMTRGDDWQVSQIAAAIQRDASLTTEVLRMANSSLYNQSGQRLVNLEEAVLRIGQRRIGELALTVTALAALTPGRLPWLDLELTWKRSMAAGIALERLVEVGGHQAIEEGLLLSAIMHPLGRVALGMVFPRHYETMIQSCAEIGTPLQEQEQCMFPTSHTQVLAHLLATWRIPPNVFVPLKFLLEDFSALARLSEPARTKVELVKLAVLLGRLAVGRWESWDLVQVPSPRGLKRLRISDISRIIHETRTDLSKLVAFRADGQAANRAIVPSPPKRTVAYCNVLGSGDDCVMELLPSMGLQAKLYTAEELRNLKEPSIVNCLGIPSRLARQVCRSNTVVVTDYEHRDLFEGSAPTVPLPNSYGRVRDALISHFEPSKAVMPASEAN